MSFFSRPARLPTKLDTNHNKLDNPANGPLDAHSEATFTDEEWYSEPPSPLSTSRHTGAATNDHGTSTEKNLTQKVAQALRAKGVPTSADRRVPDLVAVSSSTLSSQDDNNDDNETHWTEQSSTASLPPQLKASVWRAVCPRDYPVRSATYLHTKRKQARNHTTMSLWAVDLVQTDQPLGLCAHSQERFQQSLRQGRAPGFCLAVNICLPAPQGHQKMQGAFYQFVAFFGVPHKHELMRDDTPVGRLAQRFFQPDTDDSFRNATFKLIPKIIHGGGFVFRQAVGAKPVLLGQKVSQKYFCTEHYCEVLVDIASDPFAKRIVRMALGLATHLTVDLSFCLEGKTVDTLPEQLLGGVRVQGLSFADDGQRYVCTE